MGITIKRVGNPLLGLYLALSVKPTRIYTWLI